MPQRRAMAGVPVTERMRVIVTHVKPNYLAPLLPGGSHTDFA